MNPERIQRINTIEQMLSQGKSLPEIGSMLNISKQRVYQLMLWSGISTPSYQKKSFYSGLPLKSRWLWRNLSHRKSICRQSQDIVRAQRIDLIT